MKMLKNRKNRDLILLWYCHLLIWGLMGKLGGGAMFWGVVGMIVGFGGCWRRGMWRLLAGRNWGIVIFRLELDSILMTILNLLLSKNSTKKEPSDYYHSIAEDHIKNGQTTHSYIHPPHSSSNSNQPIPTQYQYQW